MSQKAEKKKRAPAKPVVKKASKEEDEGQHLKRFSIEFLADVAALCQLPTNDVRKVLDGLRKVLLKQMKAKRSTKIPNIALLRIKTLKARPATKKMLFGVGSNIRTETAMTNKGYPVTAGPTDIVTSLTDSSNKEAHFIILVSTHMAETQPRTEATCA